MRLAMCILLLEPYNLLVLDEPTNHLDLKSKDVLKNALIKYDGSLLIVSHDRDFMQNLTQKVIEFKNGSIKQYIGDISEYLEVKRIDQLADLDLNNAAKKKAVKAEPSADKVQQQEQEQLAKEKKAQLNKLEKEIERLESEIKKFDEQLSDPDQYNQLINDKSQFSKYEALKRELEISLEKWEKLA